MLFKVDVLTRLIIGLWFGTVVKTWDVSSPANEENHCAEIFIRSQYRGPYFIVKDEEQFSDISDLEYYLRRENERSRDVDSDTATPTEEKNNTTEPWSFRIRSGCSLKISSTTYLKGEVEEFLANEEAISIAPKSVACECPKICKCEDHKLRKSECARAYLNDDCTNCKAPFTTLKPGKGEWESFPEKWASQVSSIVLRKGCTATIGTHGSPEITLESAKSRVVKDIQALGDITRYMCTCFDEPDDDENSIDYTNKIYPKLIDIPRTRGAINTQLFNDDLKKHPGLLAALQSLRRRRSSRNAYILLLGLTGSGKSSAVNLIFDHPNITKVGDFVSTTTDILQFSIPVPVPELGMKNTALHVIDTPGIGDTRGFSQDAQFLATLEEFLSKHEDLKRNKPNVVLIFTKFSDNRFRGEGSRFVKMLRTIDLFKDKIIDKKSTNVIFVLTHYMSETKELTRDPRDRVQSIREVIEEFSTLPRPINIVLAENKPEQTHLPNINGFWRLPNGEFYPKNLFDQMQRNLVNNEDPVGEAIIRTAFSNSDNFNITGKRMPILRPSNAKVTKYLGILASFTKTVTGTEVATKLNDAYELLEPEVKRNYPDVLNTLQRTLHRNNILHVSDLPGTSVDVIKLFQEIQINPMTLFLMEQAFNITVPDYKNDFVVGSGYSLVKDATLPAKIFELGQTENVPSDILYRLPGAYQVALSNRLDNQIHVFTNKDEFIAGRIKALGLPENIFPKNSYSAGFTSHPGFNLISLEDGENQIDWNSLTATVDYHTFQIRLTGNAKFSPSFDSALENLSPLNVTSEENVQAWKNFFDVYGTHVVVQAFGGGSIQVKAEIDNEKLTAPMANSEKFAVLSETMASIVQQLANELIRKNSAYEPPAGVKYHFSQIGGNHKHFWSNFSESDETKNIDEWRESLRYEQAILKSRLYLVPISEVVKEIGRNVEQSHAIEEAASQLLNASLIFVPVERIGDQNPDSRDNLEGILGAGDFESMQRFADMFKMISATNQDMQTQIMTLMAQSQARRDEDEQKYQERLLEMKREEAEKERQLREDERYRDELEFKRQQLEMERIAQERALQLQLERDRLEAEMKQKIMLEDIQSKSQQTMLHFLNAENERNTQIMIAQMSQKSWWEKAVDKVTGTFETMYQSAAQVLPAALTFGAMG